MLKIGSVTFTVERQVLSPRHASEIGRVVVPGVEVNMVDMMF